MTDLWTLIDWFFYGLIRYVLFWIPLVTPFRVNRVIPSAWWRYNSLRDWFHRDDNNGGPDEHWIQCWFRMVFGEAFALAVENASSLVDSLESRVLDWIGGFPAQFLSLGGWIDYLKALIGDYIPWWAETVVGGLTWLRDRLPEGIKYGWQSWDDWIDGIKVAIRIWVRDFVAYFHDLAVSAWNWVQGAGEALKSWRDHVSGWIDGVRADPYGFVVGQLGDSWAWLRDFRDRGRDQVLAWLGPDIHSLLVFGRDCVGFYYSLWSAGWQDLGEFAQDPRGYLMDRLERAIIDRW